MNEFDFNAKIEQLGLSAEELPFELVARCIDARYKIAVAESCTGGIISAKITDVPGASAIFDCGVCSYANGIKQKLLGVREKTLLTRGAVSAQTALQMADGVRKLADADIGVSVTGIAGPDGGTDKKPVGLVYIAVSTELGCFAVRCLFSGSRAQIREHAAHAALYLAIKETEKEI